MQVVLFLGYCCFYNFSLW